MYILLISAIRSRRVKFRNIKARMSRKAYYTFVFLKNWQILFSQKMILSKINVAWQIIHINSRYKYCMINKLFPWSIISWERKNHQSFFQGIYVGSERVSSFAQQSRKQNNARNKGYASPTWLFHIIIQYGKAPRFVLY